MFLVFVFANLVNMESIGFVIQGSLVWSWCEPKFLSWTIVSHCWYRNHNESWSIVSHCWYRNHNESWTIVSHCWHRNHDELVISHLIVASYSYPRSQLQWIRPKWCTSQCKNQPTNQPNKQTNKQTNK